MASPQMLLVLLCITVTVGTAVNLQKRIYGGKDCPKTERLYHVEVRAYVGTKYSRCGGSLISDRWILTAAHCWKPGREMRAVVGIHPGGGTEVIITKIVPYTDTKNNVHDIMLLQLPSATTIKPVSLPDCVSPLDNIPIGDKFSVAGFGRHDVDNDDYPIPGRPDVLQCAEIKAVDCKDIRKEIHADFPHVPDQNWLCGEESRVSTCKGDSGGGVVYNDKIHAVVTGSIKPICTAPVWFLKVCPYFDWIRETMAKNP